MAQDILITPGSGEPQILFRGSGTNDTPIELNVLSSYQSASSSGSALLFEGTEGQLFAITDNLSSGVIFSVAGAAGLPFIEADASGDVRLIEYGRYVGVGTGTPAYQLDVFGTGRFSNGIMFGDGTTQTTAGGGGGGTPGGSVNQIQINDGAGGFTAATNNDRFIYDTSTNTLDIGRQSADDTSGAQVTNYWYQNNFCIGGGNFGGMVNSTPTFNTAIGIDAAQILTEGDRNIAIGYSAGESMTTADDNILIGYFAGGDFSTNAFAKNVVIGNNAMATASTSNIGSNVVIGYEAGYDADKVSNSVIIGYQAHYTSSFSTTTEHNIYIGDQCPFASTDANGSGNLIIRSVGGYGTLSQFRGQGNNELCIGNIYAGNQSTQRAGIGDVNGITDNPDATLHVLPKNSSDTVLKVQGAASQSANLQEWQSSAGVTLAEVDNTGNISGNDIVAANDLTAADTFRLTKPYGVHIIQNGTKMRSSGSSAVSIEWTTGGNMRIHSAYYNSSASWTFNGLEIQAAGTSTHQFYSNGGLRMLDIGNEHYQGQLGLQFTSGTMNGKFNPNAIIRTSGTNTLFMYADDGVKIMNLAEVGVSNTGYTGIGTEYRDLTARTGIFTSGIQFGDGTTQTTAAAGGGTPGGSDTNIQFNNGGSFSGESTLTWNYDTDALTVSGNTLMAGTGVILDVQTTGGTTLFAVEDTTETTLVVNSQDGQTSHPFEVRDAFGIAAASIDVSGNISGNHLSFGDGTTQTTAATASGPPAVVSDTGTAITMVCNTHADKYLRTTANSAVTITFPSGLGCDANSEFTFEQAGSGQITVTGAAGVTINTSSTTKTYTQFSVISMKQVATDTYTLFGDTASF